MIRHFSQVGQDKLVDEFLQGNRNGVFVDVGAHDGVMFSNTFFFELFRDWLGVCVEPSPESFPFLIKNRMAKCIQCAVSDFDGTADFLVAPGGWSTISRLEALEPDHYLAVENIFLTTHGGQFRKTTTPVRRLQSVLDECKLTRIDFLSLDIEGQELRALRTIDFSRMDIRVLSIENCHKTNPFLAHLKPHGYRLLKRLQQDEIFVKDL